MTPERFRRLRKVLEARQPDLTVLMERVHKPHNFSAILRSCDAVGVFSAHVVPGSEDFNLYKGTSGGSDRWVEVHLHDDVDRAIEAVHALGMRVVAAHPSPEASDFRDLDLTAPTCIMMGAELHGLSARGLELADEIASIPMAGMVGSLNVSVASALMLFEAYRQRSAAGLYDQSRLDPELFRKTLFEWAYPRIAERYRKTGKAYPSLDEDGEILS